MDRIDLELYADRLARHSDRLVNEIGHARTRLAWSALERGARDRLDAGDCRALEAVGVLADAPPDDEEQRALVERRRRQLDALGRLQAFVEEQIAEARGAASAVR